MSKIKTLLWMPFLLPLALCAGNLFENGDFEEGNDIWCRAGTSIDFVKGAVSPKIAEEVSRGRGRRALRFEMKPGETFFVKAPYVYWPFVKGYPFPADWKKVTLSFAAKTDCPVSAEGKVTFRAIFCKDGTKDVVVKEASADLKQLAADWKVFSVEFDVPVGFPEVRFVIAGPKIDQPLCVDLDDLWFGPLP